MKYIDLLTLVPERERLQRLDPKDLAICFAKKEEPQARNS